jgi:hypothetical protein
MRIEVCPECGGRFENTRGWGLTTLSTLRDARAPDEHLNY